MNPMSCTKIVRLGQYDFPDPNTIRGILIYNEGELPRERVLGNSHLSLLVGQRRELERLLCRKMTPDMTVSDDGEVRRISQLYVKALSAMKKVQDEDPEGLGTAYLISVPQKIVFVTDDGAYVRGFCADNGKVYEQWMLSTELWDEFVRIGYIAHLQEQQPPPGPMPELKPLE